MLVRQKQSILLSDNNTLKYFLAIRALNLKKPILQLVKILSPLSKTWHMWRTNSHKGLLTIS